MIYETPLWGMCTYSFVLSKIKRVVPMFLRIQRYRPHGMGTHSFCFHTKRYLKRFTISRLPLNPYKPSVHFTGHQQKVQNQIRHRKISRRDYKKSCSTQLSTKFQLLIKTRIPTNEEMYCFKCLICCIYHANNC